MKALGILGVTVALLLAACGARNEVTIKTDGMRFVGEEVRVKAGAPVTLHIVNQDGFAHAFDLDAFGIHTPLPAKAAFEAVIPPAEPGRYRFYCGSPGHEAAGMAGVLVVEP